MEILKSLCIAFSMFTTLPVPASIEWKSSRLSKVPFFLPVVGIIIGILLVIFIKIIECTNLLIYTKGLLITIYFIVITGGFHLDGLMDSADGYFSRRDIKRKLEIMSDSRVGAFAVIAIISIFSLKWMMVTEVMNYSYDIYSIFMIPIISRIIQPILLLSTPFAKEDGLAKMYGNKQKGTYLYLLIGSLLIIFFYFKNMQVITFIIGSLIFYWIYKKIIILQFGGITGDLLGAFLEINELILWSLLVATRGVI